MASSTDLMYNADSREIQYKLILHFATESLIITKDSYLINAIVLEEAHTDGNTPFGKITSNELDFTLHSPDGLFCPTNPLSHYYGLMKKGVQIDVFVKPVSDVNVDWDPLGVFYITDWTATITGITADISAADQLYEVFEKPKVDLAVEKDQSHKQLFESFFTALEVTPTVDSTLDSILPYTYAKGENKDFLSNLCIGAQADCFCNHNGLVVVKDMYTSRVLRAVLKDDDQVKTVTAPQSILSSYDGVSIVINTPQESAQMEVLELKDQTIENSLTSIDSIQLSKTPLFKFLGSQITGSDVVRVSDIRTTPNLFNCKLNKTGNTIPTVDLSVFGTTLSTVKTELSDVGNSLLEVDNIYIQELNHALYVKEALQKYVNLKTPVLKVTTRGNAKLQLGDKVQVISEKYHLDYLGIIYRAKYTYDGGLECELYLLNATVLQEV